MRRSSDGDAISLMESSTDGLEGEEPGSPRAWGAVDWTDSASSLAHVFVSTSSSLDTCYLQSECLHSGHRCGNGHYSSFLFYNYNQPRKFHLVFSLCKIVVRPRTLCWVISLGSDMTWT